MATGFHGAHVLIGTIFLIVCLVRAYTGHFTPTQHLGFEFAAWYWHFVDVVWLFLFACIYVWGQGRARRRSGTDYAHPLIPEQRESRPRTGPRVRGRRKRVRAASVAALFRSIDMPPVIDTRHGRATVIAAVDRDRPCRPLPALRQGHAVLRAFSTVRRDCEECGLDYRFADAGDGPAIFVILISGFIVVGAALIVEVIYQPPFWLHARAVGAADPAVTLAAAAPAQGSADRAAISSQGRRRAARAWIEAVSEPAAAPPRRRGFFASALFVVVGARRTGRARHLAARAQGLEGRADRRNSTRKLAAPPADLPPRERWPQLNQQRDEFRRVAFPAEFIPGEEALVYTARLGAAPRRHRAGLLGVRAGAARRRQHRGGQSRLRAGRPPGPEDARTGPAVRRRRHRRRDALAGSARHVHADRRPRANLWFARDPAAMAAAKKLGRRSRRSTSTGGAAPRRAACPGRPAQAQPAATTTCNMP